MALDYFANNGMIPPNFCNPATFFMKCMNPKGLLMETMQQTKNYSIDLTEEIKQNFKKRLSTMVHNYKQSRFNAEIKPSPIISSEDKEDHKIHYAGWVYQTTKIMKRSFINQIRNPMELKMKIITTIFMSIVNIIVFSGVDFLFIFIIHNFKKIAWRISFWHSK